LIINKLNIIFIWISHYFNFTFATEFEGDKLVRILKK